MKPIVFATKIGMSQTWTKSGKRLPVTRLKVAEGFVMGKKTLEKHGYDAIQVGFGEKKLKNVSKPLRTILTNSGFSLGVKYIREVRSSDMDESTIPEVGQKLDASKLIEVGDVVRVQGQTKGRGFAGVMKRHGFKGGQRTHGQSDRARAPGSIGSGTTPGRVYKGKRMAGQYGDVVMTIKGLQVVYFDAQAGEIWVNGPVPGAISSAVRLQVVGKKKFDGLQESEKIVNELPESPEIETNEVNVHE